MKKPSLIFLLSILSLTAYSQIIIKKTITQGDSILGQIKFDNRTSEAKLTIKPYPKDTVYNLSFRNESYFNDQVAGTLTDPLKNPVISFSFEGGVKTIDSLYDTLNTIFLKENRNNPNYKVSLQLGETEVTLNPIRQGGLKVQFNVPHGYILLSKRDIYTLLGKKKADQEWNKKEWRNTGNP